MPKEFNTKFLQTVFFCLQTFFNSEALNLIRTLITGGSTTELEQILAEGVGLVRGDQDGDEVLPIRNRSAVALLPLEEGVLEEFCVRLNLN